MKFLYQYRTSDNKLKSSSIDAADRESAFAELRKCGIRPAKLEEAPGLLNKLFGKGKRWIAIFMLSSLLVIALVVILMLREEAERNDELHPISRCQIYGDPALISEGYATKWGNVFDSEGERFLALYAQPGKPIFVQPTPEVVADFERAISTRSAYEPDDTDEVKKLKCIVEGMKKEAREYVRDGGRLDVYFKRVVVRQQREYDYYASTKAQLESMIKSGEMGKSEVAAFWAKRNDMLRSMGIAPIPMPRALSGDAGED